MIKFIGTTNLTKKIKKTLYKHHYVVINYTIRTITGNKNKTDSIITL